MLPEQKAPHPQYWKFETASWENFCTACWGTCNRCGGVYFFTSEDAVDKYLGSELWANIAESTPWTDITYEKYEVASKM